MDIILGVTAPPPDERLENILTACMTQEDLRALDERAQACRTVSDAIEFSNSTMAGELNRAAQALPSLQTSLAFWSSFAHAKPLEAHDAFVCALQTALHAGGGLARPRIPSRALSQQPRPPSPPPDSYYGDEEEEEDEWMYDDYDHVKRPPPNPRSSPERFEPPYDAPVPLGPPLRWQVVFD